MRRLERLATVVWLAILALLLLWSRCARAEPAAWDPSQDLPGLAYYLGDDPEVCWVDADDPVRCLDVLEMLDGSWAAPEPRGCFDVAQVAGDVVVLVPAAGGGPPRGARNRGWRRGDRVGDACERLAREP